MKSLNVVSNSRYGTAPAGSLRFCRVRFLVFFLSSGADGDLIPITVNGQQTFVKDRKGQVVKSRLDEAGLQKIREGMTTVEEILRVTTGH